MPFPKIKLSDDSGNAVSVTDNRLNVNAYLSATPEIDIGDVSLLLGGTAASTNAGTMDAQTLRVTLATDDTHWGTVGTAADVDGTAHGQLRYIGLQGSSVAANVLSLRSDVQAGTAYLYTIDVDTGNIATSLAIIDDWDATHDDAVSADGIGIMLEAKDLDGGALPNGVDEGDAIRPACSLAGIQYVHLTDELGRATALGKDDSAQAATPAFVNVGGEYRSGGTTYTDGDATILQTNINGYLRVDGSDVTQPISGTVTANLGTTDNGVLDAIAASLVTIDSDTDAIKTAVQILDDWDDSNYANVNINLAGSDAPTGGGAESGALRVTLANDSTGVISIDDGGNTITVDGTVDLGTTDNAVLDAIAASLEILDDWDDSNYANVNLNIAGTDVDGNSGNKSAQSQRVVIATDDVNVSAIKTAVELIDNAIHVDNASFGLTAGSGIPMMAFQGSQSIGSNDIGVLRCTAGGALHVNITSASGAILTSSEATLGTNTYTETNTVGSIIGVVRNDVLATLANTDNEIAPLQVDAEGALYTTHGITGMVSGVNSTVSDSTAEQLDGTTDGSLDVACKRVDLMATQSNTGDIWVGDSGVTSNGAGGGMQLKPGDFYSIDVNNLNDIWVIATVDEEDIHFTYYT